jgi:drug/metabolite transporter (DMT)-like permease
VSVLLGLLSAFFYGATDFVARFASRRVGILRTMFFAQTGAGVLLSVAMVFAPSPAGDPTTWSLLLASDMLILGATVLLYHALSMGRLSVVAPVAASYGGVTAVLAALGGERLPSTGWVGLAALFIGAVLVARPPKDVTIHEHGAGLTPATLAAFLYGAGFWLQGAFVVPVLGSLFTVWSYYALGAVIVGLLVLQRGLSLRIPGLADIGFVTTTGLFAVLAYIALVAGPRVGSIAIVTMLSSLASGFALLFATILLKEKVAATGWIGAAAIILGLLLLNA